MAVNTVSTSTLQNWQLIATNTTTSGTSSTFSGLAGYKQFMVSFKNVSFSASNPLNMRFNSDSTNLNYVVTGLGVNSTVSYSSSSSIYLSSGNYNFIGGLIFITNVLEAAPKYVTGTTNEGAGSGAALLNAAWLNESAITSIVFAGGTFTSGTISLYGIAA